jgi:hypothetical protein
MNLFLTAVVQPKDRGDEPMAVTDVTISHRGPDHPARVSRVSGAAAVRANTTLARLMTTSG